MKNKVCKTLGENISKIRKQKKLKQDELAELIGVETKSLSLVETGNGFVTAKTLEKISEILKVPVSELFEEENSKSASKLYSSIISNLETIKENSKKLEALNIVLKSLI